ncbi:hypothetical protein VitviT2T_007714 [Vitis vinifera]|uniref:PUM-HD domain-containing protein n=1 Tax=Vitis vinifera TaxID=29760 RepID=A0ABY9BZP3_VITVI|nr:pumilio homolog 12 [Vitis vinifera]WJZ88413.1 hypothetical protein VitviT2T_007714 [Vitis vinifera]|eukprot:XP_010651394.1 PREDICTED: pumilio homolog 12 [Vitis vinifera]
MEGRTELDEIEKLLGEIPNATSGHQHFEEFGQCNSDLKRQSLGGSFPIEPSIPVCVNFPKRSLNEKFQNYGSLDEGKLSVNKSIESEEPSLPDDHLWISAFAELSFKDGVRMEAVCSPLVNYKALPNQTILFQGQCPNSLKRTSSNLDPQVMVVPSSQSPNPPSSAFNNFDVKNNSQESSNLLKLNVPELKKQQFGNYPPIENFSNTEPLPHGVRGFPFFPNVPVPGAGFPAYLHPQQLGQHKFDWMHVEKEHYHKLHQQYRYQVQNMGRGAQHPIQANGNVATRLVSQEMRQPYFETPHQFEKSHQESFWNKYRIVKGLNESNPGLSSTDFNAIHVLDKVGKMTIPEKILTRSNGLNSLRTIKFGSIRENEAGTHVNQNGRVIPNGHFRQRLSSPTAGHLQLDSLCTWSLSTDTAHLKTNILRPQPQKYNSVDEVVGRIYHMSKDQNGCRFLQRKFTDGSPEDVQKIFLEIIDHIVELMTDPFGNYLVQKLLEVCTEDQQMQILHAITRRAGDLVRISCNMHGTRAVQKVIETLRTSEQFSMIVSSLKPGIVTLIKDMNGNHVAQCCLQNLMPEYREFLFEAAITNCVELATDRHGCCVLQKCLGHSAVEQRDRIIYEITSNALILSQDPFGNYVVQYVFEFPWAIVDILDQLEGNYGDLSLQKYSSNVVEKCLQHAGDEHRHCIIQELINNPRIDQIMQDPYGNYVIQAALNNSKGAIHAALIEVIRSHVHVLRTSPYGKKVLSCTSLKK